MSILKLSNVNKSYQIGKDQQFYALKNINLEFEKTGFVCVVGRSGSGKSSLLNLIAKLDNPTSGSIYINNKEIIVF